MPFGGSPLIPISRLLGILKEFFKLLFCDQVS